MSRGNRDAKRALLSLVAALPKCHCGEPALWIQPSAPDSDAPDDPRCHYHRCDPYPVTYADELMAVVDLLGTDELRSLGFIMRRVPSERDQ